MSRELSKEVYNNNYPWDSKPVDSYMDKVLQYNLVLFREVSLRVQSRLEARFNNSPVV
jgi:hypothetical protein